ncbi:MAG: aspartate aminotransferase family protein [Opitutales bacterium]
MNTQERYTAYSLGNYAVPPAISIVEGQGAYVWDEARRRYLDMTSGIAVTALGHGHPAWVKRVQDQAATLSHCSNLFGNPNQAKLAEKLVEKAGPGRVFFCNSGAEANEALIKLARLWGYKESGDVEGKKYKVVVADTAFHGRTFGGMSATPQPKIQKGFGPLVPGFTVAKYNDIESFEQAIDDETAAVFIETIQGEGGIRPFEVEFLQKLRALCTDKGVLMLIDEVQCGIARTGKFFAYEHAGIQPDAIGMAKGLGNGFPIGAVWIAEPHHAVFTPGTHGTTFGGSPLACAAALATLDTIESEDLMGRVNSLSPWLFSELEKLKAAFPELIYEIRGRGFMIGIGINEDPLPWMARFREEGMLIVAAGNGAIRLLPPLTVAKEELSEALNILKNTFQKYTQPVEA